MMVKNDYDDDEKKKKNMSDDDADEEEEEEEEEKTRGDDEGGFGIATDTESNFIRKRSTNAAAAAADAEDTSREKNERKNKTQNRKKSTASMRKKERGKKRNQSGKGETKKDDDGDDNGKDLLMNFMKSWFGRIMFYAVIIIATRAIKALSSNGNSSSSSSNNNGKNAKSSSASTGRAYFNNGKSVCDAIKCDYARAQMKRVTRERFRASAHSAFENIMTLNGNNNNNKNNGDSFSSIRNNNNNNNNNNNYDEDHDDFVADSTNDLEDDVPSNKPLVLAIVSDDQNDFDLLMNEEHNPFKIAEKKGCFKRIIINDSYESKKMSTREISERKGEIQKDLSEFFLECGRKVGGGVVYIRMAKHINARLLPALLPAFSENGGYTVDGNLVPSKDFVFVLEVFKPILEKSSAFSRERSEYANALKKAEEATFTRIIKSKLAFYWGVDEEDESLSANALAMRRRVDFVLPISITSTR